ncbi:MAG TPA: hypothetical protein VHU40_04910 [Polyangia bacterium]|nr:hypothetical protein [Polyangia bacterium]
MALLLDADATLDGERAESLLARLRSACTAEGLNIVLPLAARAFDAVVVRVMRAGGAPLEPRRAPAGDVILIGDGGPTFFARFQSATPSPRSGDPLDDFTRARLQAIVGDLFGAAGVRAVVHFPFVSIQAAPVPFQRLGQAAGLPGPGPLGLQVHPVFGPWWAYRALIATPLRFPSTRPTALHDSCGSCARPCVTGCAAHAAAPRSGGLPECGDDCGARMRCPVGVAHRYPEAQLAFHARARERLMRVTR